jgi:hypothetical protein
VPIETEGKTLTVLQGQHNFRRRRSERGAIAIMAPFVIIVMIAMFGMAVDLSRTLNRKVELQSAANAAALIAASALNGTQAGIDKAIDDAKPIAEANTFSYGNGRVSWSSAALTFGTSADGGSDGWMSAEAAKNIASRVFFARADTAALDSRHGKIENFLMPILSSTLAETDVSTSAVAGRDSLDALPLAICANSNTNAASLSSGELVEYGFRRGISYDLMNLNPVGRTPENFLLNPIAPPGTVGSTMKTRLDIVRPIVCTGRMPIPTLLGGEVTVERGFPLDLVNEQLNSRFGTYGTSAGACLPSTAPADVSVKQFDLASITWMKDTPAGLSATPLSAPDPLLTVAEKPLGASKTSYGPLWSYAKAAKYSSWVAKGGKEPSAGYDTFKPTDWGTLYTPGKPAPQGYTSNTPYQVAGGIVPYKRYRNTRVLRIPLLRCPVAAGTKTTATVVGIAKFFMTIPASSTTLYAEFAGMDSETALGGNVRLQR